MSLAKAKAQLSALVAQAQHRGRKIIILRHGKPSAAIVPVEAALASGRKPGETGRRGLSARQIRALFRGLGTRRGTRSAVADLIDSRR